MARRVEDIYETLARAVNVVVCVGVLLRIGHVNETVDIPDSERSESSGNVWIGEGVGRIDLDEILTDEDAVVIIEWAERMGRYPLPPYVLRVSITGDGDEPRRISISQASPEGS